MNIQSGDGSNWGLKLTIGTWSVLIIIVYAYLYDYNPFVATNTKASVENVGEETDAEASSEVL